MKKQSVILSGILIYAILFLVPHHSNASVRTIDLEGYDSMKFSVTEIKASPGDSLHITLTTVSQLPASAFMSHNWVLLKKDTDVQAFVNASVKAKDNGYIAPGKTDAIIAYTRLAAKGETTKTTFTVPSEPGKYTYVCTFPGHYAGGMKGVLIVTEE